MASSDKKICISFDWHNDRNYRNMLSAWLNNPYHSFNFIDLTPGEIDTNDISRVKGVLTSRIRAATHTLVLVGAEANKKHPDSEKIGALNWIWWEVEQSKAEKNGLIVVKIDVSYSAPDAVYGCGAQWADSFDQVAIAEAIDKA